MLHKTTGIVLKTNKYSETSVITKVYTEKFGLQTYIINGVRTTKSKGKYALYQHGNILDMVVYHKETGNMFHISEVRMETVYNQIPFDTVKGTLLLFCIELLLKTIKEEESNANLFQFLHHAFIYLDETTNSVANFHIIFLLQLSKYIGFYPDNTKGKFFNLDEGVFTDLQISQYNYMHAECANALRNLLDINFQKASSIHLSTTLRKELLHALLLYYSLHIEYFGEMHSPAILEEVFRK
ncbi:MAG: DNA repair protein RecO [Bacteroidetes bacterium]|nr:DNA repair protein RecO [Bacteroidota bacterium]MBP7400229.1 DNA repair protein RecO [Chitinophagales bacterium]MBK7108010.1 DNA repair protein RecO [Bacteroidota bacterium]MBK8486558.1 DNA repair protein RecO [Bacteroidota bacterium]MBK8683340.1 DNA repair protein RecO [Bacteroidota bacterium]